MYYVLFIILYYIYVMSFIASNIFAIIRKLQEN